MHYLLYCKNYINFSILTCKEDNSHAPEWEKFYLHIAFLSRFLRLIRFSIQSKCFNDPFKIYATSKEGLFLR